METMQRKQPPPPVVHAGVQGGDRGAVPGGDRPIGQVAKEFDLTGTAVRAWVNQAETDAGERPGLTSGERAELARLRRGNRSLREDVEVLKRATAFSRQGDPVKAQAFIEAEKAAGHGVARACRLLKVSRAAYYQRLNGVPSARRAAGVMLSAKITSIHEESRGTCGSPRVHRALRRDGSCGKRRVARLMRAAGLEGRRKKRWRTTTIADPAADRAWDLIQRDFAPRPGTDRRYAGDITYVMTWEGWAYLLVRSCRNSA